MDYVTRQFINLAKKFRRELPRLVTALQKDINEHTKAIRAANESDEDNQNVTPIWVEPILAKYDEAERKRSTNDERAYRIQNSIRWATWCAFFAAAI